MRHLAILSVLGTVTLGLATQGAFAIATPVTVSVSASLAPNSFGSPSYTTYVSNAEYALENGLSTYGSGPAAYAPVTGPISRASAIVTGFNSWKGDASPAADFGAAYANELGNRMSFPVDVKGNGTKISISQLSFTATSNGDLNGLGFSNAAGSYNYGGSHGIDYIGIIYGPDGVLGGGDDTLVTSGANSQPVDEIVGRGSGNSYAAYADSLNVLSNQQELDLAANDPLAQWDTFTGAYTIDLGGGNTVSASSAFTAAVPEPTSLAVLAGAAIVCLHRRRRHA